MGSQSDWQTMKHAAETLDALDVAYETRIVSAHRTPERLYAFAKGAKAEGFQGDHRRRRRRGASAGDDGFADQPSGFRRAGGNQGAVGTGFALLHRADAARRAGWHAGDRPGRRPQRRASGGERAGAERYRSKQTARSLAAKQTAAVAEAPKDGA